MSAPMILPWLARKWGVSEGRALELWQRACADAELAIREHGTSRYWGFAKGRLIDLLDEEVLARYPVTEAPWIMIHLNLLRFVALGSVDIRCFARMPFG